MWLQRIWLSFNTLTVTVFAVYALMLRALSVDAPGYEFLMSGQGEIVFYSTMGVVLLVNLGFVIYTLAMVDRKLVFRNAEGEITISLRAVEIALSQAASTLEDLDSVKVRVRIPPSGRGPVQIDALGTIKNVADLRELTQKMQALIKIKLAELLQLEGDLQFNVHFHRTARQKKETAPQPQQQQPRTERRRPVAADEFYSDYDAAAFPIKYPVNDESD